MTVVTSRLDVGGPYYEDLFIGQRFNESPGLTLTAGLAAVHQAVLGDRMRLALDADLAALVLGPGSALAHPALVCDVAIGQSTVVTERVVANLFYRGLVLLRPPRVGDTLRTSTEIVALRDNVPRAGRPPTGLAVLRVRTVDQEGRPVLDFYRCAMLPMRSERSRPGHANDLDRISVALEEERLRAGFEDLRLGRYLELVPGPHVEGLVPGVSYDIETGDPVTSAPELVRLTLNLAVAHRDAGAAGRDRRLVYGGHTIGLAFAHVTRALPNVVTVAGWRSCDHLAPVFEGDQLRSVVTVDHVAVEHDQHLALVDLHVETVAVRGTVEACAGDVVPVLDWRLVVVMAA